jgi:hypothetical protein
VFVSIRKLALLAARSQKDRQTVHDRKLTPAPQAADRRCGVRQRQRTVANGADQQVKVALSEAHTLSLEHKTDKIALWNSLLSSMVWRLLPRSRRRLRRK